MRRLALVLIIASVCVGGVIQPLRDPQALHFANQVRTMTDGDTTPDVSSRFILVTANTTATTITDFDRGAIGQVIFVIIGDANTTFDFTDTNLHGNGGYDYAALENDFWVFTHDGAFWYGSFLSLDLANSVLGTTNRVTVTDNLDGTVTLTSPQDTHTSASMALANIYLADNGKAGNTDNYWQFHDDVDFVTLSASSNLGLGTDTPDSQLTIQEGINPLTADADADSILIRGVGALGITLATGTDGSGNIFFDDGEDGNGRGRIIYDHSDDSLAFYTNSSEAINIDSDGNILITDGNELRFNDIGNSHYVGFEAPALTATQIWVLPDADGDSGELLSTDGSGALSWSAAGSSADDTAYDATSWNGNAVAATKNAIRDKIETIDTAIGLNTDHRGESSGNPHSVTPTELSLVIGTDTQAWDTGLDSLAALTYATDSFIKATAEDTYAIRTISQTQGDLGIDLNTTHRDSNGVDHGYIDQSVVSGAAPAFTADNFSDGGSNAIITTTQETNFETGYAHSQDNTQAHSDYLINNGDDATSGSLTATDFYVGDDGKVGNPDNYFQFHDPENQITTSLGTQLGIGITPTQTLTIGSADGSDSIEIYHDNTDAYFKWNDGILFLETGEDNTDGEVQIRGNGASNRARFRVFDQGNVNNWNFTCSDGIGTCQVSGASTVAINIQPGAQVPIRLFANSTEGETQKLLTYGWATGDSESRHVDIQIDPDVNAQALFNGDVGSFKFDGTIKSTSGAELGDGGSNKMVVSATGDTHWVGSAGLIFGAMFIPGVDIIVPINSADPCEIKDDGTTSLDDGWEAGELNEATFPTGGTEHYLTVPTAGKYEVVWSMSGHTGAGGATGVHVGIMIDGVAKRNRGEGHRDVSNSNDDGNIASSCIVDCPNGTEEISLWVAVDNGNEFHAEHGTVVIKLIGGT